MQHENIYPLTEGQPGVVTESPRDEAFRPSLPRKLGELLVDAQSLTPRDLERALQLQETNAAGTGGNSAGTKPLRIGDTLLKLKLITEEDLSYALSRQFSYPSLRSCSDTGLSQELVCAYRPFSLEAEAFRKLRSQLLLRWKNSARRTLTVVSPSQGEGRSYVAANLAVAFAQMGKRTLLVDADLRNPRQERIFNIPRHYGLSGMLGMTRDPQAAVDIPGLGQLSVVVAGAVPPNPQELLSRMELQEWLDDMAAEYAMVLVDTPACGRYMDAAVIASQCTDALVVVRKDHTRLSDALEVTHGLGNSGVQVVGTVLNRF